MARLEIEVTDEMYNRLEGIAKQGLVNIEHLVNDALTSFLYQHQPSPKGFLGFSFKEIADIFYGLAEMESRKEKV